VHKSKLQLLSSSSSRRWTPFLVRDTGGPVLPKHECMQTSGVIPTGGGPAAIGGEISGAKFCFFPPSGSVPVPTVEIAWLYEFSCSTGPNRRSPNCYAYVLLVCHHVYICILCKQNRRNCYLHTGAMEALQWKGTGSTATAREGRKMDRFAMLQKKSKAIGAAVAVAYRLRIDSWMEAK